MKKITLALALSILTLSVSAFGARESKCIVKLKYKVEREGNRQYLWCLDDWEEDGYNFFYTTRRHVMRDVSEQECKIMAKDELGRRSALKFVSAPPLGMVIVNMMRNNYECDGTVVDTKFKYKKAKY